LAANLIEDLSKQREARYGFVHEQIRQTLVSTLSFPRRQRMHLWVAEALQQMLGDSADKQASTIAHHLYQAGAGADLDKTVYFLTKAAERAADTMAFENAINHLDAAISVLGDEDNARLADLLGRKAMALQGADEIEKSLAILDEAIDLSAEQAQKDRFIFQRSRMLLDIWRGKDAVEDLEKLLERARKSDDRHNQLELERWMARAYYVLSLDYTGYAEKTKQAYESTIALARELDESKILAMTLVQTTQLVDYWSEYIGEATKNLEEADSIARATGDEDIEIDVATARLSLMGDQDIDALSENILTKLLNRRDPVRLNAHYFRMMWSKLGSGRLERCVEICDAGIELAYRIGTLPVQYPSIKSMALMEMGQFGQAWTSIEEEISDSEHRFGAALQGLAKFQYEVNTGSIEAALARCTHVICESKVLNRVWMLRWVSAVLARLQTLFIEDQAMLQRLNQLIDDTGMHPGAVGKAAMAIADGQFEQAATMLDKRAQIEGSLPHLRNTVSAIQIMTEVQIHLENFNGVLEKANAGIALCADHNMQFPLWQLLAQKSKACAGLGQVEESKAAMKQARNIHSAIAATIPQADHRKNFAEGGFARMLGI
jgi:tetratricopeptide (TPR) repeat protein